jgi:hypothetical protein
MRTRRLFLSCLCWAALAAATAVQAADALKIDGPDRVPAYRQVRLSVIGDADDCEWDVVGLGNDLVSEPDGNEIDEKGTRYEFTAAPGRYRVVVTVIRGGKLGRAMKLVTIDSPTPGPTPGPTPTPTPGPTPPTPGPTPPPGPTPTPGPPNPGPVPGFDAQANGRTWAKELIDTFADSLTQAGRDIMDGKSMDQAKKDHIARWAKTRDDAFNARFVGALDQLVPPNVPNPTIEQRRRYAEFIQSLTQGSKEAVH